MINTDSHHILIIRERPWESFVNDTMTFGYLLLATFGAWLLGATWPLHVLVVALWLAWMIGKLKYRAGLMRTMTPAELAAWMAREYPQIVHTSEPPRTMGFASPPTGEVNQD